MPLTPDEVAGKVFSPTRMRRGYAEKEVDAFLDQVQVEINRLTSENGQLRRELEKARGEPPASDDAPPAPKVLNPPPAAEASQPTPPTADGAPSAPAPPPDDATVEQGVARMLVLAQRTADAALSEAKADADHTRGSARMEAERVLIEARTRAAEETGRLERSKTALETEVEQLQEFEREYRRRLRAYLEMQLRDLELGGAGPAAVEGRRVGALDAGTYAGSPPAPDAGLPAAPAAGERAHPPEPPDQDPLMTGLTERAGSGPRWSPSGSAEQESDPKVGTPPEPWGQRRDAPFDAGSEG
jgi:DivIVA domain-containing protein